MWHSWDMLPQQGVTSDLPRLAGSRGSFGKIWSLRGLPPRQGTCHAGPVCGSDIRFVALQEAEVHRRGNHLLIIYNAEMLRPPSCPFENTLLQNIAVALLKCQEFR